VGDHEAHGGPCDLSAAPDADPTGDLDRFDDPDSLEAGRLLFAQAAGFVMGVAQADQLPPVSLPEVAFAGRSNVGKSSLINALVGRKALARASNTPGRTQEINFFALGERHYLVDLPGYGFAEAPKPVVERWQALLKAYLAGRPTLRRAFLLIDARHGPKPVDAEIMDLLDRSAVTYQAVLTKADKPGAAALAATVRATAEALARHPAAFPEIVVTSAEKGTGLETLRAILAAI
jgi:ribosome biogenesis GTP-binding protein YsxC/EngB